MKLELLDRRVLGAIRLLNAATGLPLPDAIKINNPGSKFLRNPRGYYVIQGILGNASLEAHTKDFLTPPNTPEIVSVSLSLQIMPLNKQYLPRRYTLKLPRDPNPVNIQQENSLFKPVDVRLFLATNAPTAINWAVLRATVKEKDTNQRLPWALILVLRNGVSAPIARSLADWRGEALIAVPGVPATTWVEGSGPVLTTEIDITLEVIFDPTVQTIPDGVDFSRLTDPNQDYLPDPDDMEARRGSLRSGSVADKLAAGSDRATTLLVTLT